MGSLVTSMIREAVKKRCLILSILVFVLMYPGVSLAVIPLFDTAIQYGAGDVPTSVASGDFDRDGNLDLATANELSDSVSVLLGK